MRDLNLVVNQLKINKLLVSIETALISKILCRLSANQK